MKKLSINWIDVLFVSYRGLLFFLGAIGFLVMLSGLGVIGFQIYMFLYDGDWVPLSSKWIFVFAPDEFKGWLQKPMEWVGLQRVVVGVLDRVPLSLTLLSLGFGSAMFFGVQLDEVSKEYQEYKKTKKPLIG